MTETCRIPQHVAIIMDGNGRWAEARGMSRLAGHRAGTENLRRVITAFAQRGVNYLTLYAFSTENWSRPPREVQGLLRLLASSIRREAKELDREGVRLVHLGKLDGLSSSLQSQVREAVQLTADNTGITVGVAFNYGGRDEILEAVRKLMRDGVPADSLNEALFARYLYTSDLPDPDLIVRTGGEMRLSNFLLWQSAYSEYYATPVYWPDFDEAQVEAALQAYSQRQRRFGGLGSR